MNLTRQYVMDTGALDREQSFTPDISARLHPTTLTESSDTSQKSRYAEYKLIDGAAPTLVNYGGAIKQSELFRVRNISLTENSIVLPSANGSFEAAAISLNYEGTRVKSALIGRDLNPMGRGDGIYYFAGAISIKVLPALVGNSVYVKGTGNSVNNAGQKPTLGMGQVCCTTVSECCRKEDASGNLQYITRCDLPGRIRCNDKYWCGSDNQGNVILPKGPGCIKCHPNVVKDIEKKYEEAKKRCKNALDIEIKNIEVKWGWINGSNALLVAGVILGVLIIGGLILGSGGLSLGTFFSIVGLSIAVLVSYLGYCEYLKQIAVFNAYSRFYNCLFWACVEHRANMINAGCGDPGSCKKRKPKQKPDFQTDQYFEIAQNLMFDPSKPWWYLINEIFELLTNDQIPISPSQLNKRKWDWSDWIKFIFKYKYRDEDPKIPIPVYY